MSENCLQTQGSDRRQVISCTPAHHALGISLTVEKSWTSERTAHPATLTILGSKVSTCFRRAFIVFPVSTMAWRKERAEEVGAIRREGCGSLDTRDNKIQEWHMLFFFPESFLFLGKVPHFCDCLVSWWLLQKYRKLPFLFWTSKMIPNDIFTPT